MDSGAGHINIGMEASMMASYLMCEVIVGSAPKCLPTSVPVLPILLRAKLYCLQYLQSFPPIVHLFYLT